MKKLVLLGDSIRMIGYGTKIKQYLPDYEIWQPDDNCRFARYLLRLLFENMDHIKDADIIHFNAGIWDTCDLFGDGLSFTPIDEYVNTISRIADILLRITKKVYFSTTLPIRQGQPHNKNEIVAQYNDAVTKVLIKKGVKIIDLNGIIKKDINRYIREDDCIHLNDAGIDLTARAIASVIKVNEK